MFKKILLFTILSYANLNCMEDIKIKEIATKQDGKCYFDYVPKEIIKEVAKFCTDSSVDELDLGKTIAALQRIDKRFNEIINKDPEFLKLVYDKFESLKETFYKKDNKDVSYEHLPYEYDESKKTLFSKLDLPKNILHFKEKKNFYSEQLTRFIEGWGDGDMLLIDELSFGQQDKDLIWLLSCNVKSNAINQPDNVGHTVFKRACSLGWIDLLKLLLKKGANINSSVNGELKPLLFCISNFLTREMEIAIKFLLDNDADANADWNGQTALIIACRNGHATIAQRLIEKGAKVSIKASHPADSCETPLMFAVQYGHEKTVNLLLKKDADVFALDKNNMCAYDYAFSRQISAYVKLAEILKNAMNEQCKAVLKDENYACQICANKIDFENEVGFKLQCNHVFHKDCIMPWVKEHKNCPICKLEVK